MALENKLPTWATDGLQEAGVSCEGWEPRNEGTKLVRWVGYYSLGICLSIMPDGLLMVSDAVASGRGTPLPDAFRLAARLAAALEGKPDPATDQRVAELIEENKLGDMTREPVKERPILFSGPMVRAILDGSKTQTRRVVKPQPKHPRVHKFENPLTGELVWGYLVPTDSIVTKIDGFTCPFGNVGDRLWVRETWCRKFDEPSGYVYNADGNLDHTCCWYKADGVEVRAVNGDGFQEWNKDGSEKSPWEPSIHMPRWASRITLEITDVRVQRLHDISHDDAIAEGAFDTGYGFSFDMARFGESRHPETAFECLWDSINAKSHPWESNPWVWAISFEAVQP